MKLKIAGAVLVVLAAAGAALAWLSAAAPDERVLMVIASGEIRARARRCGCQGEAPESKAAVKKIGTCACKSQGPPHQSGMDLGAIPERSAWQRAVGGDPLVVDAGDLFFPRLGPIDYERPEWQCRAELIVTLMERLGLAAFTPGELDLALGRSALEGLAKKARFSFVAANLRDAKTHLPVFKTRLTVVRSGLRVGIVGVVDPPRSEGLTALLAGEGLELSDSLEAVRSEAEILRSEGCDLVLLVAHAPDPVARAIAAKVGGIELAVHAHPEVESNATSAFDEKTVFGVSWPGGGIPVRFKLHFAPGGKGVIDYDRMTETRTWLERVREQLEGQIREREKATGDRARELDEQIAMVAQRLREREATLPREPRHEVEAWATPLLAASWKHGQDPEVLAAIERFKQDVTKLGLDAETAKKIETPGVTAKGRPDAYAGAAVCVTCHKVQRESWEKTRHARAWSSLERTESQKDPTCVGCHSIGFRKPGGFAEPRRVEHDGRDYRNVQCESCHGARLSHTDDPKGSGVGLHIPTIQDCRRCHDQEHDPSFDEKRFENALKDKICVRGLP